MDGATAAPDIATAAGSVKSRRRLLRSLVSKNFVSIPPTSGPPISRALNVKLVTPRPGGAAPGSDTFAAAHTSSVGQLRLGKRSFEGRMCVCDMHTSSGSGRASARPASARPAGSSSSPLTRRSANAVQSRLR